MNTIVVGKHLFLIQILYKDNSIAFLLVSDIVLFSLLFDTMCLSDMQFFLLLLRSTL